MLSNYEVNLTAKHFYMKSYLITASMLLSGMATAQYCTSGGPTSTADSNVQLVRIVGVGDSIRFVGCPAVLGVQNLTNLNTSLNANTGYSLSVQFGTCGGNYAGAGEAWIDYDQSGTFDLSESLGTWTGTPPTALSIFNFFVPASAQNGVTRMRVIQQEGTSTTPLNPCATFTWGSVMDFSITISGGVDCSAYLGDDTADAVVVPSLPYTNNGDNSYCYGNQNSVYPSPDVYYLVIPSAQSFSIRASLCGSSFDTFLSVIDPQGNVLAYNDDGAGCAPQSELVVSTVGVDSMYFIVEGWGTFMGTYTLQLNEDFVAIEEQELNSVAFYPNPASDYFQISGGAKGDVVITNPIGETVGVIENYNGEQISTATYPSGIYLVHYFIGSHQFTNKIVIER